MENFVYVSRENLTCSICLDLFKDPVTLNCGHSFCMSCITDCWDQDDDFEVYECRQCGKAFTPRPVLGKNTVLAEVLAKLKTEPQAPPQYFYPGIAICHICTGKSHNAVKSCLVCMESYCQKHFEQHEEFHSSKRHKMIDDTDRLEKTNCHQHDKPLEMYCYRHKSCVCKMCVVDGHATHNVVPLTAARTEIQGDFEESQRSLQERIQNKCQELKDAVETRKRSAQTAVDDTERFFTKLIRSIEKRRSEVTKLIRDQEKTAVIQAEGLLKRLEWLEPEIISLGRDAKLEQLLKTEDHIHFLQNINSFAVPHGSTDLLNTTVNSVPAFDNILKSVSQLKEKMEDVCKEEQEKISDEARCIEIIPIPEHESWEEFLPYAFDFTLDPNTVNKSLRLDEDDTQVTYSRKPQGYPDHPDRFEFWNQVLCEESVSGRCYWEVEWSGQVGISVSYKTIMRKSKSKKSKFGGDDQSWILNCSPYSFSFCHNDEYTKLPAFHPFKIGVYVDHSAGTLSFYSIYDTMTLIHRVQTTFTQPLYPGFSLGYDSEVILCDIC
ncbi:tripartite motif-containing protein 16-like protein isoform X3 [Misgurnus anguillicaudatus]|uniref:tripartite motif-containing protein 16-like protein isoform X3 n=1 Tax=Misgurnus anguillicaudatus TaxID=75329 RepID=UPI003CCFC244